MWWYIDERKWLEEWCIGYDLIGREIMETFDGRSVFRQSPAMSIAFSMDLSFKQNNRVNHESLTTSKTAIITIWIILVVLSSRRRIEIQLPLLAWRPG